MWSHLEHTIKNQRTTLEENVPPVPTVVFDDAMRFCFHPEVERDQGNTSDPSSDQH